ncbi:MAG: hypothetical protein HYU03_07720 [Thaumarchaeota archaeon]|nr:hypothetical protein [Nitrososphaerota archaeon]MCS4540561.1 hypothetical protein [Nitrososphaerota archaeon]
MDLKPIEGLKVKVNAVREAIFGEEGVEVKKIGQLNEKAKTGVMTGRTLAGYSEVEMSALDGERHWYPIDQLVGEKGEKIVEEEIKIEIEEDSDEEEEDE